MSERVSEDSCTHRLPLRPATKRRLLLFSHFITRRLTSYDRKFCGAVWSKHQAVRNITFEMAQMPNVFFSSRSQVLRSVKFITAITPFIASDRAHASHFSRSPFAFRLGVSLIFRSHLRSVTGIDANERISITPDGTRPLRELNAHIFRNVAGMPSIVISRGRQWRQWGCVPSPIPDRRHRLEVDSQDFSRQQILNFYSSNGIDTTGIAQPVSEARASLPAKKITRLASEDATSFV